MNVEKEFPIPGGSLYYEFVYGTGESGGRVNGRAKSDVADADAEKSDVSKASGIRITRLQGMAGEVEIPARIEGIEVCAIGRKAFLSKKNLRKVTIPSTVTEVGDWAFAYCDSLHTVRFVDDAKMLPDAEDRGDGVTIFDDKTKQQSIFLRDLHFGKTVFMECSSLRFVYLGDGTESTAALMAAAVTVAEAAYLLDAREAGSREWLEKWDARMLAILHSADDEGYSKQILCGEEDYGSTDLVAYESERRRMKVRLLLLRCLYPEALSPAHREEIKGYLRMHSKPDTIVFAGDGAGKISGASVATVAFAATGSSMATVASTATGVSVATGASATTGVSMTTGASVAIGASMTTGASTTTTASALQDETWQVVLREHGEEQAYYELFTDLGCVTEGNFDALLADVGEEYPQLRAYLMRYKEEKLGYSDFFAGLEL